jgi:2-phospho-L-lactate transferase/gluconeogenesis factor (CofD/UPF0052 family)
VQLSLLINAYDDGRSTGKLRALIPGMPGPADFRKNLALMLEARSRGTSRLLEHRLARGATREDVTELAAGAERDHGDAIGAYLEAFFAYAEARRDAVDLDDCAVGNIILAGAYLYHERDFNHAIAEVARAFGATARLVNVDTGEVRVLVALKEDGALLDSEAMIVGAQSRARIADLFSLAGPLDARARRALEGRSLADKRRILAELHREATISREAKEALYQADLVVYGPGTQFSSLLPSYAVRGVPEAIEASLASARVLFVNLREDHDTAGLGATDLVDGALRFLDDPANDRGRITHVLSGRASGVVEESGSRPIHGRRAPTATYRGAHWIEAELEDPAAPGVHDGERAAELLLDVHAEVEHASRSAVAVGTS